MMIRDDDSARTIQEIQEKSMTREHSDPHLHPGPAAQETSAEPDLARWIGREERSSEIAAAWPVTALNATLDRDDPPAAEGDLLPPLYHWMLFQPLVPTSALDVDGHPKRGGFLPPVTLPRRMWASSEVRFEGVLRIGERLDRVSRIANVEEKQGASGPLVFVTITHEISGAKGSLVDRQTVVYREMPPPGAPGAQGKPAPSPSAFSREVIPSAPLLFRYSALTFNAHRIHYDAPFTRDVEGYPGLVVHGPLIATLLCDLARRTYPSRRVGQFGFRAVKPIFDHAPFVIHGREEDEGLALWAADAQGDLCTLARLTFMD